MLARERPGSHRRVHRGGRRRPGPDVGVRVGHALALELLEVRPGLRMEAQNVGAARVPHQRDDQLGLGRVLVDDLVHRDAVRRLVVRVAGERGERRRLVGRRDRAIHAAELRDDPRAVPDHRNLRRVRPRRRVADAAVEVVEPERDGDDLAGHPGEEPVVDPLQDLPRDRLGDGLGLGRERGGRGRRGVRGGRRGRSGSGSRAGSGPGLGVGRARREPRGERHGRRTPKKGTSGQHALQGSVEVVHRRVRRRGPPGSPSPDCTSRPREWNPRNPAGGRPPVPPDQLACGSGDAVTDGCRHLHFGAATMDEHRVRGRRDSHGGHHVPDHVRHHVGGQRGAPQALRGGRGAGPRVARAGAPVRSGRRGAVGQRLPRGALADRLRDRCRASSPRAPGRTPRTPSRRPARTRPRGRRPRGRSGWRSCGGSPTSSPSGCSTTPR